MTDDAILLRATVAHALELADQQERHPVAAMLADILAMLDCESDRLSKDSSSGAALGA